MASSSTSPSYLVFLSFCGKDTRQGFISHLYDSLCAEGVETFIDEDLPKGERIDKVFEVIKEARIYIVVYSKSYASSKWCLNELAEIMKSLKCMNNAERYILPVFYKVDPSDVRRGNSITHYHLQNHELELGKNSMTVAIWKAALIDLAGIAGWHFENGAESKLVKDVGRRVLSLLQRRSVLGSMGNINSFFSYFKEMGNRMTADLKNALDYKYNTSQGQRGSEQKVKNQPFTPTELQKIIMANSVIGEDEFARVYLGTLPNGTTVALKVLRLSQQRAQKNFLAEAQLVMSINHRNLVSLFGYCDDAKTNKAYLVYEYLANGYLRQYLSNGMKPKILSWDERLRIARDVARGLCYLHNDDSEQIVIHGNLKTSTILLSANMEAMISDFGFSQTYAAEVQDETEVYTRICATPGYMDPDFFIHGRLSKKADVYSFGIVLFELITGRHPITRTRNGSIHILKWVNPLIERRDIQSIVDPSLDGKFSNDSVWKVIEIAMSCVMSSAQRPDITRVLAALGECLLRYCKT